MSEADWAEIIGYMIASFAFGYTSGYIHLWFKKLGESI